MPTAHPATVNKCSSKGQTPLLLAVGNDSVSCVDWLLQHGADPNLSNKDRETPLLRGIKLHVHGRTPLFKWIKLHFYRFDNTESALALSEQPLHNCTELIF